MHYWAAEIVPGRGKERVRFFARCASLRSCVRSLFLACTHARAMNDSLSVIEETQIPSGKLVTHRELAPLLHAGLVKIILDKCSKLT